jgi:hypothetical protein
MSVFANFSDLWRLTDFLKNLADGAVTNQEAAVMEAGRAYEADMKKSSQVPLKTGQYKGSIRADLDHGIHGPVSVIGSPMPQTLRLEYGFYSGDGFNGGVDSLGRQYNQMMRPHWRPTWDFNLPTYERIMFARLLKDVKMT